MQSFQLIKPCLALAPYIRHYWILQDDSVTPVSERTLPIGCMQLVFHKGKQLLLSGESELQPQSFISGQSVGFSDVQSTGRIEMITVVFQPYAVKALFHIPSHLFHGQNVDTDAMEDVELSDLVKQVTDTSDNAVSIRLIEQFFLRRLYTLPEYNLKRMSAVFHEINLQPQINIAHLSETACLSSNQVYLISVIPVLPRQMYRFPVLDPSDLPYNKAGNIQFLLSVWHKIQSNVHIPDSTELSDWFARSHDYRLCLPL